jgi:tRNA U34 5-methylaminomethyl-2-thiouridine-forming methyltransferase MnmC
MSLGLGLGYNELLVADYCYQNELIFHMVSYEKDPFLKDALLMMLGLLPNLLSSEIQKTYQKVFSYFSKQSVWSLQQAYCDQRWVLKDALTSDTYEKDKFHVIFWDAFSRKTSPELWDESFLTDLFREVTDVNCCVLSTYACNGPIKRSLKANQFEVTETAGFQNKRQSVLATRFRAFDFDSSNV